MYAVVIDGQVQRMLDLDTAFVLNGRQYPANWLQHADAAARETLGIFPVLQGRRPPQRYGLVSRDQPVWDAVAKIVHLAYTIHPVDLAQAIGAEIEGVTQHGRSLLALSEQIVLAAHDAQRAVPDAWTAYRALIRTEVNRLTLALTQAADETAIINTLQSACWPAQPSETV